MLLDTLHFNHWFAGELEPLLSKVTRLGYDLDFFGDRLATRILGDSQRAFELEQGLKGADSLLVIAPFFSYTAAEAAVVQRFVERGGRVVIAGDPTRFRNLNPLASVFGVNFEADFLYNPADHDANYRNVVFRDFATHPVTRGLSEVVLYTAGSITGAGQPLMMGTPTPGRRFERARQGSPRWCSPRTATCSRWRITRSSARPTTACWTTISCWPIWRSTSPRAIGGGIWRTSRACSRTRST
jgi:hypothetical protein